ncbi:hypothetical protein GQ53DRAFT_807397 [Thozetella sp. PMI_491]|nr:hypothetical protein GQ53DRAFT_807397 [Thozetella sp. PMI_491]
MADSSRSTSRRLALNACNACRRRKTKCDEKRPQCGRCTRLELTCMYEETLASRKDLSTSELNGTLQRVEDKLDTLLELNSSKISDGGQDHLQPAHIAIDSPAAGAPSVATRSSWQDELGRVLSTERHSTAPQHLLSWPCSPRKLSQSELQYPVALEIKQSNLPEAVPPPACLVSDGGDADWLARLSISQFRFLAQLYFSHFHPSYMILDEMHFFHHCLNHVLQNDFDRSIDTCIVLLVLGLGSVAAYHMGHSEWAPAGSHSPSVEVGLSFFTAAKDTFRRVEAVDWPSVQCLLLMASFYSCKLRVLDSWRATHNACGTILILLPLEVSLSAQHCQLYWIAYLQESQILAEFDLPASGLATCASGVPLPVVPDPGTGPHHRDYQFSLLAVIALRRLLNRIHSHLYSSDSTLGLASIVGSHEGSSPSGAGDTVLSPPQSLISELDRQLEEWRACLPPSLEFSPYVLFQSKEPTVPGPPSTNERLKGNLMARYFAAKSILHRPFLYRVLHNADFSRLSQRDMTGAQIAIDSAFQSFLHNRLLQDSLPVLVHPINAWRSLVALELQTKFILRAGEAFHFALPEGWNAVLRAREQITRDAGPMSPCIVRDSEILQML